MGVLSKTNGFFLFLLATSGCPASHPTVFMFPTIPIYVSLQRIL